MEAVWRIEMLGTLRATRKEAVGDDVVVTRFRTRRVTLLLAYLACYRHRLHSREEVGEMLWPDTDPEVVRRNLRQALSSLRHVLEPPPLPVGSILQVEQARLRLNPALVATDLAEFETAIEEARRRAGTPEEIALLKEAIARVGGEFLPGHYEDWILHERVRLDDLYVAALRRLVESSRAAGRSDESLHYLRLALDRERLNEEWHVALMREYLALDRPASAIEQFGTLKEQLRKHLGCDPSEIAYGLLNAARRALRAETRPTLEAASRPVLEGDPVPPAEAEEPREREAETPAQVVRLPIQLTRFCGREIEIERTLDHLQDRGARLTTLMGPAGTGKTRLSVEVGRRLAGRREGNVWFVALADLASTSMIPDAILDTIRARRSAHRDPLDNLREAVLEPDRETSHLLILDNMEHILDEAVPIVVEILGRVPNLQILVTSRRSLNLEGEHLIPVPPLPTPSGIVRHDPVDREELERLAESPSLQLFVDRCQTVRPDFGLTLHNARAVAAICARLEGIPLAIELAAGLSGSFTPGQMLYHLDRRLTALTSRKRDTPARHRSLAAAVAYSYDTLTPELQRLFAALSVFRGGFTIEAAHQVCLGGAGSGTRRNPHAGALELVLQLQERSLLVAEPSEENRDLRFRMLESFREVGEEHLDETETHGLRARHAAFFRTPPPLPDRSPTAQEITERHLAIEAEFDNEIAAIGFFLEQDDDEAAVAVLETLRATWTSRGPREIERSLIRRIAERVETRPIDPTTHITLLRMLGTTHIRVAEYAAAYAACARALEIAERHALPGQIAVCYSALGTCTGFLGQLDECLTWHERVLALVPEDDLLLRERAYLGGGAVYWGKGDPARAEERYRRAAEVSARLRGGEPDTLILCNLAHVALDQGRFDEAMTGLGEAIRSCNRVHDEFGLAIALSLVSRYHWLRGNAAGALSTGHEALRKFRDADFWHFSLVGLFQQALILTDLEEWPAATMLLAATSGMGRASRAPDREDADAALEKIRARLSPAAFERAWAKGLAMNTDEAFRLALGFR